MSPSIAFFDFDGTLTKKDSFLEFLKFECGLINFYWGFAFHAPFLIAMKLKLYPNWKAKERVLTYFLKGKEKNQLERSADLFCKNKLPELMRKTGLKQLQEHIERGDKVYIVSASASLWVKPWCKAMNLNLIATELEVKEGKITGKILGENCYGPQKVVRIKKVEIIDNYELIYAYGDSSGDKEMLAIADQAYYKYFKD